MVGGLFWIAVGRGGFVLGGGFILSSGGWYLVYFEWCWVVVGLFELWWVVVGLFWVMVGGGG